MSSGITFYHYIINSYYNSYYYYYYYYSNYNNNNIPSELVNVADYFTMIALQKAEHKRQVVSKIGNLPTHKPKAQSPKKSMKR